MFKMECKNCGGNVLFDKTTKRLYCEYCNSAQYIDSILSDAQTIANINPDTKSKISMYIKALDLMALNTEQGFDEAANIFLRIPLLFDSSDNAAICRQKETELRNERLYNSALVDMQSNSFSKILGAKNVFVSLGAYMDSKALAAKCDQRLQQLQQASQEAMKKEMLQKQLQENAKRKEKARSRSRKRLFILSVIVLIIVGILLYNHLHSASNIKISLEPSKDNYLVDNSYGNYTFQYDVKIKNNGYLDIDSLYAELYFENEDGEVILSSRIQVYNDYAPAVRAGKISNFTWNITVSSYDTAVELYQTDFSDIKVNIDITTIYFSSGKIVYY